MPLRPGANGRHNSRHCWLNNVGSCCVRLPEAKLLLLLLLLLLSHLSLIQRLPGIS